jgi:hypothetical protein
MDVNPRQNDPQFQSPLEPDSQPASQFGMGSQADVPMQGTNAQTSMPNPAGAVGPSSIVRGTNVYGSDGKKVGTVKEVYDDSFLVQRGIIFVHDYFIPYTYVARTSNERIDVGLTADEARSQNWARRPGPAATPQGQAAQGAAQQPAGAADYGVYGPPGAADTIQSATERGETGTTNETAVDPSAMGSPTAGAAPDAGATPEAGAAQPSSNEQGTAQEATTGQMGTPASDERLYPRTQSPGSSGTPGTTPSDVAPEHGTMGAAGPAGAPGIPPVGGSQAMPDADAAGGQTGQSGQGTQDAEGAGPTGGPD